QQTLNTRNITPPTISTRSIQRGGSTGLTFFFFNDTATTELYTLSLHDALPISPSRVTCTSPSSVPAQITPFSTGDSAIVNTVSRSEEHTSELQSRGHLVCRLLLEKKKN